MKKIWLKIWSGINNFIIGVKNTDFYKTYKEEMVVVPLVILAFYLLNGLLISMFPHSSFFDFFSQIETIVSKIVLFVVALWVAHLSLRVSFPKVYKFLHEDFYQNFDSYTTEKKIEIAVKFILVFILAAALIFKGL